MDGEVIRVEEIQQILLRYAIGKKPLAKLLGWGEATIIRYLSGDIPTKEYSQKLYQILEDAGYYRKVLEENRERITKVAYQKSLRAVCQIILEKKSSVYAHYLKNVWQGALPPTGYLCLLYYFQGFSLAMYGTAPIDEDFKVTEKKIPYEILTQDMCLTMEIPQNMLEQKLSLREKKILDGLSKAFSWYGYQAILELLLAEEKEYSISRNRENERIISKDAIEKKFRWIIKEYRILKPEDINKYVDSKYAEIRGWQLLSRW